MLLSILINNAMETLSISLEDFIATKLLGLSLVSDESTASFVQGIIEEDSFEAEVIYTKLIGTCYGD